MRKWLAMIAAMACILALTGCNRGSMHHPFRKEPEEPTAEAPCAMVPMVMVEDTLYLDTGYESNVNTRCGMMDGEITSQVHGSQKPAINGQSNFGTGYSYQYGSREGTIDVYMNGKWRIFATEEVRQNIQFPKQEAEDSQTGGNENHTGRTLTQEEIDSINDAFAPVLYDKQGNPMGTNIWSCFFTSYYEDIRDMDFEAFLRYYPADGSVVGEEEFASLKDCEEFPFPGVSALSDMPVPVHKYSARIINLLLKEYAGITLEDLDTSKVNHLSEYDAFYNYTSDYAPGMFLCTRGEIDGDCVRLYEESENGTDRLTLKREGDRYLVAAHEHLAE